MNTSFCPPKPNPIVLGLVKAMYPFILSDPKKGIDVQISAEDKARLKAMRGKPLLLLPNHPTGDDPVVMFEVARRLNEMFYFVAAREVFEFDHGFRGWVFQRCGVYSLIRGKVDRDSFKTTRSILAKGEHPLVIFIEGEISSDNESLIPFEPGVIQLAYWGLEDALKEHSKEKPLDNSQSDADATPLYVAPVAIKYQFSPDCRHAVEQSIERMEKATGIKKAHDSLYLRIRDLGIKILSVHEGVLGLKPASEATINDRASRVKATLLSQMELFLHLSPAETDTYLDRIRHIRNRMDKLIHTYDGDWDELSDYDHRMIEHLKKTFVEFYADLERLVNFMTFEEGKVAPGADLSVQDVFHPERYMSLIARLEREIFGKTVTNYPRTAIVKLGTCINLAERFSVYELDKKSTVKAIANELESDMNQLLKR